MYKLSFLFFLLHVLYGYVLSKVKSILVKSINDATNADLYGNILKLMKEYMCDIFVLCSDELVLNENDKFCL